MTELEKQQQIISALIKGQVSLESELDAVKTDLAHEVNTLTSQRDEYSDMLDKVEDAADYWKNEFEQLFNAIHRTVGDLNKSDEKCVSDVIDILIRYDGQSDEQLCTKQIGNY